MQDLRYICKYYNKYLSLFHYDYNANVVIWSHLISRCSYNLILHILPPVNMKDIGFHTQEGLKTYPKTMLSTIELVLLML
jgi:hypothetical protein